MENTVIMLKTRMDFGQMILLLIVIALELS